MTSTMELHLEVIKSGYLFDHITEIYHRYTSSHIGGHGNPNLDNSSISLLDRNATVIHLPFEEMGHSGLVSHGNLGVDNIRVEFTKVESLTEETINLFVDIIDQNIGDLYTLVSGDDWKEDKSEEMKELGLIYGSIKSSSNELMGFVSFKLCTDNDRDVLYLYEIQILEKYRNFRLGSRLMNFIHYIPNYLNNDSGYAGVTHGVPPIFGNSLTVFSKNEKALKFYKKLGYFPSDHSPVDRTLRSGKVLKPDYYILIKPTSSIPVP